MKNKKGEGAGMWGFLIFIVCVLVFVFFVWPVIKSNLEKKLPVDESAIKNYAGVIESYEIRESSFDGVHCKLKIGTNATYDLKGNYCLNVRTGDKLYLYTTPRGETLSWSVEK